MLRLNECFDLKVGFLLSLMLLSSNPILAADDEAVARDWLRKSWQAAGDVFEVMGVVAGGPAEEAGLEAGDQITVIDRQPAAEVFLPELRVTWRTRDPGTPVKISYRRDNSERQTTMVLRDLIAED